MPAQGSPSLVGLPDELLLDICQLLCPHCQDGPPGLLHLDDSLVRLRMPPRKPAKNTKADLLALSLTCRALRPVAQYYVFHSFVDADQEEFPTSEQALAEYLSSGNYTFRLQVQDSHSKMDDNPLQFNQYLAGAVRELTLSSESIRAFSFKDIPGLESLKIRVDVPRQGIIVSAFAQDEPIHLPSLRSLRLIPGGKAIWMHMSLDHARPWLWNICNAAPSLESVSIHLLHMGHSLPDQLSLLPDLPGRNITSLELFHCYVRQTHLEYLVSKLPTLRRFRLFSGLLWLPRNMHGMPPVNAYEVVMTLKPVKNQLEFLDLDFGEFHQDDVNFRPLPNLTDFTALKVIRINQGSIGLPSSQGSQDSEPPQDENDEEGAEEGDEKDDENDKLVNLFPNSIEFICIADFHHSWTPAAMQFAREANGGRFPNLRHVRLIGCKWYGLHQDGPWGDIEQKYPHIRQSRLGIHPIPGLRSAVDSDDEREEARTLFRSANIRFECLELSWPDWPESVDVTKWNREYF